jgi:molybdopterin synthase catalytic subunit
MRTLGICGPGAERVADRLGDRLSENPGDVAVVRDGGETDGGVTAGRTRTEYALGPDGWSGSGTGFGLAELLERLARDHEYALVVDAPGADLPTVVLGDVDPTGEVVFRATGPDEVDLDDAVDAVRTREPYETLESLVARVKASPRADRGGAIATFTGRVRARDGEDDTPTEYLEFEKYEGVADERMRTIETELEARDGVLDVLLHHRTGVVADGEDIVFVVVLAGHREEAFRTVEDGIDRLKAEVPLFKKEVTTEETFWVHERD